MGWCQQRYREINLVAREQISNKAPAEMVGDWLPPLSQPVITSPTHP